MRILFAASDTEAVGGIQQYNRKFLECLRVRGDEVRLVELKRGEMIKKIRFAAEVLAQSARWKPDLVVCAHVNYAPLGFLAKKLFGRRYMVCTHGIDVWEVKSGFKRTALREADLVTTVAEFTRDKIVSQLPETQERVYLLYNSVDGKRFVLKEKSAKLVERHNLRGKKVIFTVARLLKQEGYKGYDRVIESLPRVLETIPNAVYLLGGKGDDAERVKNLIRKFGLEKTVIMAGYIPEEEIVDYYNLADVFVMPSKAEGAPTVFMEALACGVPVIAGNKDGSGTPLMNGELGLLINPDSVEEIASAIITILKGEAKKELLDRDFLRRKVLEEFGLDSFSARVDEALRRAVHGAFAVAGKVT